MKTFIVTAEPYMFEDGHTTQHKANSLRDFLLEHMDYDDDGESLEELENAFNDSNGDGMAYVTVFCVEDDRRVLG